MEYLVSGEEMKRCDANTIRHFQISSAVLMERAALCVLSELQKWKGYGKADRVLIAAGHGNNGGDGYALGRLLYQQGKDVTILRVGDSKKYTEDTRLQYEICQKYGLKMADVMQESTYDIIVDAILGIGLQREVTGHYKDIITLLNEMAGFKVSIDIPSGIHADTGEVLGTAFQADLTVTFGFKKAGEVFFPGHLYCGNLICRDIGITSDSFLDDKPLMYSYQKDDIKELIPKRIPSGNKGSFGKILLIAGSANMSGACTLAGMSAYRSGAGLVRIITPEENREIILKTLPEAVLCTYTSPVSAYFLEELKQHIAWADAVGIGPGIGVKEASWKLLQTVLLEQKKPLILDADALNLLADDKEKMKLLTERRENNLILTPHVGEFARLAGRSISDIQKNFMSSALAFQKETGVILVLKDARTLVVGNDTCYLNQSGNEGMATAGAGDVLTGLITNLASQMDSLMGAAALGVYIHGLAGDLAKEEKNSYSLMARDLVEAFGKILK